MKSDIPRVSARMTSTAPVTFDLLDQLLKDHEWQAADRETVTILCTAASPAALQRGWLYFSEVKRIPNDVLQEVDRLWRLHSDDKFGYTIQRKLWLNLDKNWDKLWPLIGWKKGISFTRYPGEFTWSLEAPKGHLPLTNQLRGVQLLNALLNHPAWD